MYVCKICQLECPSYDFLRRHNGRVHKIHASQTYITYQNNGVTPLCKCGCGELVRWRVGSFQTYVNGHNSTGETNPMYGKHHSEKAKANISSKRKEKFANGEYDFVNTVNWSAIQKKIWSQTGYKEKMKKAREASGWREKLSKAMSGENNPWYGKLRPEHSKLMKSPEMLKKVFCKRSNTDIEILMSVMLDMLNIEYHSQFFITHNADVFSYDFKIKELPILIEVDGDYWHGGPGVKEHTPFINGTKTTDILKNEVALQHGYILLRFWGSDIKNNPQQVVSTLLEAIKSSPISI
jgi:very-short-patch-repair endonuclease